MGDNAVTSVPVYQAADVLTAANLNITNSGIPVFSGTATRDAAFGGSGEKVLAEGQFAYLEDSDITQFYSGSSWLSLNGKIAQVISTTKLDTYTDSSGTGTLTTVTGLGATITPSATSSKVLIQATVSYGANSGVRGIFALTGGNTATAYIGNTAGSRRRVATGAQSSDATNVNSVTMLFLDSPSTTSATTYSVQAADIAGGTVYINRSVTDTDGTNFARYTSTITVMEILA
jgi:hypothetical protein